MQNYVISEELATKILAYLAEKPFKEVNQIVTEMSQLQKVNIIPPTPEPTTEEKGGDDRNVQINEATSEESNADGKQTQG